MEKEESTLWQVLLVIKMNNRKININRGFTILEVILTIIVLTVVLTISSSIIIQTFNIFEDSTERLTRNRLAEIMLTDIAQYLRAATETDSLKDNKIFKAYSPAGGTEKNYSFEYREADNKLLFKEEGNLLRKLDYVSENGFVIDTDGDMIEIFITINNEAGNKVKKSLKVYARNTNNSENN